MKKTFANFLMLIYLTDVVLKECDKFLGCQCPRAKLDLFTKDIRLYDLV